MMEYFEGWYFKIVDHEQKNSYAIIPGVSFGSTLEDSHSFVQVLRGKDASSTYHRYNLSSFSSSATHFQINVGPNRFSANSLHLDIDDSQRTVKGNIRLGKTIPWPVSLLSPGAMGIFRFIPKMECLHGILSFNHTINGSLLIDGEHIDFDGGRGYLEKDWGRSFPTSWIWMQSNHFGDDGISLTASIATIPWIGSSFPGFLVGFLYDGEIFRFTTYTGARLGQLRISNNTVSFLVHDRSHLIFVKADRAGGAVLRSPQDGMMNGRIVESLTAEIEIKFYEVKGKAKNLIYEGTGKTAGLEIVGDISELGGKEI